MQITYQVCQVNCKIDTDFLPGMSLLDIGKMGDKINAEFYSEIGLIIAKLSDKYDVKAVSFKIK